MLPIAILALLLVAATGFAVASIRALGRPHDALDMPSRREFLAEFDGEGLPANVLVEAYEALGRRLVTRGMRVTRRARLSDDLGLTAADVEDVALLVAARCEGRLPAAADLNVLDTSVRTVGELIRFLTPFCSQRRGPRARLALMA
ncbi:hypothetical protein tb265_08210 [Gemmatimonadetes bacterium T265]|nr:hypothetical protein tb265_08210 [Gemmatimonadetes bacterium T265]